MTNKELGDAIGVSASMASRLKSGKRLPGVETLSRLAKVLGLDLRYLANAHSMGAETFGRIVRTAIRTLEGDDT